MKKLKLILLLPILLLACNDDNDGNQQSAFTWKKLGLEGKVVNKIEFQDNTMLVGTDNGLYKKDINSSDGFALIGFEGKNVQAIITFSASEYIVSVFDRAEPEESNLYKTHNGGSAWAPLPNHFGGEIQEPVIDLAVHPDNPDVLFGTGYGVVAKSENRGESWTPIWGNWEGFATGVSVVRVNPAIPNELWAGGQGGIENGFLLRSTNQQNWDEWYELVPNPTVVKEIVFDGESPQTIYTGWEGGLLTSSDGGQNWQTRIDNHDDSKFFFGIGVSQVNPSVVFAGGWLKVADNPQPLILYYSTNKGQSWKEEKLPAESFGGVYNLKVKSEANQERIYLGLYLGGVYEVIVPRTALQ